MRTIQPKGKTPIAEALTQAGEALQGREDDTTLVLVSDGIETCGGDPCAVAKALHDRGQRLIVHVVGFGVSGDRAEPLRCIARAGGGRYFPAADAQALRAALSQVRESVVTGRALEPEPEPPAAPAPVNTRVRSIRASRGKVEVVPASWVRFPPRFWRLVEVETGEALPATRARTQRAKRGEYQIAWREAEHGSSTVVLPEVVELDAGETVRVPIDTGLQLSFPESIDAVRWWWLQPPGTPVIEYLGRDATLGAYGGRRPFVSGPHVVAPGTHDLWVWQKEHASRAVDLGPVQVEPGRLNRVAADFGFVVRFAAWLEPDHPYWKGSARGRSGKALYLIRLVPEGGQRPGLVWQLFKGPWLVAPGRYTVYLQLTEHGHNEVRWGELTVPSHGIVPLRIDSGVRLVPDSQTAPPPYRVVLVDLDTGDRIEQHDLWTPLPAPPGRYRLDWQERQHGAPVETLVDELQIEPGTLVEVGL